MTTQGASKYLTKYRILEGFEELLEEFVTEILRD